MAARTTSGNPRRISFAKISEPLEVPQLLSLQTDSFDWLVGNDAWTTAVERRMAEGEDVSGIDPDGLDLTLADDTRRLHFPARITDPAALRRQLVAWAEASKSAAS